MSDDHNPPLILKPLTSLPGQGQLVVQREGLHRLGRDPACELQLAHPSVSRRHAAIEMNGNRWILTDLDSRHGTLLNGTRIGSEEAIELSHGDSLAIPPMVFRIDLGEGELAEVVSTISEEQANPSVETLSRQELGSLAALRLELLMEGAGAISESRDQATLVERVLDVLTDGTGLSRAAVLRPIGGSENVEILGIRKAPNTEDRPYSRTLVGAASNGEVVRLNEDPLIQEAVSIVGSGVQQAICAPVMVGSSVEMLLYVDSTDMGSDESDAAAFTAAVARLHGLTLANLQRLDLEEKQRRLLLEMQAARMVQERITPPPSGEMGRLDYVVHGQPGRVVAGDLYGMAEASDGRIAIFLGDVAGKGVGAGMLMASIQATISAYVEAGADSVSIIEKLNTYVADHSGTSEFATMFFVQFNPTECHAEIVDAGHGYALLIRGDNMDVLTCDGGPPVGAVPGMSYGMTTHQLQPGDRIVIYSDGVAEQREPSDGMEFGVQRVIDALQGSDCPESDVSRIMDALREFAGGDRFADDVTVACVRIN
ncbi:MAG: SpoIIE family protein phosphatase [Phycisphaerales bacterium]|nr:SpoIIE family protein phosphatase [Phycisphaerales bacterium]